MTTEFLQEDLSLGRYGTFRESLSLHLLFSKCLQLKISIPSWHLLELPRYSSIIICHAKTFRKEQLDFTCFLVNYNC